VCVCAHVCAAACRCTCVVVRLHSSVCVCSCSTHTHTHSTAGTHVCTHTRLHSHGAQGNNFARTSPQCTEQCAHTAHGAVPTACTPSRGWCCVHSHGTEGTLCTCVHPLAISCTWMCASPRHKLCIGVNCSTQCMLHAHACAHLLHTQPCVHTEDRNTHAHTHMPTAPCTCVHSMPRQLCSAGRGEESTGEAQGVCTRVCVCVCVRACRAVLVTMPPSMQAVLSQQLCKQKPRAAPTSCSQMTNVCSESLRCAGRNAAAVGGKHSMAVCSTAWHCMALHGSVQHCMALHGTAWQRAALHGTAWHCMATCSTAWHCMAVCSTVWPQHIHSTSLAHP